MPFDPKQLLDLLPLAVGAFKPGSPEAAALMQGYQQSQQRIQQEQMQRQQMGRQDQVAQAQIQNMGADNARQDQALALQRLMAYGGAEQHIGDALQQKPQDVLPPDVNPLEAQNNLVMGRLTAQQQLGVPAGTPQGPLPDMTAAVSKAAKADALAVLQQAEAAAKRGGAEMPTDQSIWFQMEKLPPRLQKALIANGHPPDTHVKPSELEAFGGVPAMNAQTGEIGRAHV